MHVIHGNGDITAEDATKEMKAITEDKRRELLRLVLKEKDSIVPRECKDLFWKMIRVLHLFYIKDDGFTSHEMYSTVNEVIKEPVVLSELLLDADQNLEPCQSI